MGGRCYDWRALRRIAGAMGLRARSCCTLDVNGRPIPMTPGQVRYRELRKALEHIEGEARVLVIDLKPPSPRDVRDQLRGLAAVLREARRLEAELSFGANAMLWGAAHKRGLKIRPEYLTELAGGAEAAAKMVHVRTGPTTNRNLANFINALAGKVEYYTNRRPTISKNMRDREPYGGRFLELVKACLDPLGIKMSNHALGGAVERVLASRIHKLSR